MGVNLIRQWIRDIMSPRSAEEGAENLREGYRKIYTILKHAKEEDRLKEDTPVAFLTKLFSPIFTVRSSHGACWAALSS